MKAARRHGERNMVTAYSAPNATEAIRKRNPAQASAT